MVEVLDKAFPEEKLFQMQALWERMWRAYHCIRTSHTFTILWRKFLPSIHALPIFYQSLTDRLFQKRIDYHFYISCSHQQVGEGEAEGSTLTFGEENAICYAAGYVLYTVRKKTSKSSK